MAKTRGVMVVCSVCGARGEPRKIDPAAEYAAWLDRLDDDFRMQVAEMEDEARAESEAMLRAERDEEARSLYSDWAEGTY
jgi:transcription elongation factor Elf1